MCIAWSFVCYMVAAAGQVTLKHIHCKVRHAVDAGVGLQVDPLRLGEGLHYGEVQAFDRKAKWRGPIFRYSWRCEIASNLLA